MTLLEDIQNSAIDGKSDLAELLRKCKLLAARLGSQPLEDWVIWESNGYPEGVSVPDYRTWSIEVLADFAGPFQSSIKNARIPIQLLTFLSEKTKQFYSHWEFRQSIASIEDLLRQSDDNATLTVNTGALALQIGTKLYQDGVYNCVHAWGQFGRGHLVEVENAVRNRILDFALAVDKESPNAGEKGNASSNIEPARISQIFNTTIYGGAANIVGTATDSSVNFNIGSNDFTALEKLLLEKGADPADIADLKQALDSEPVPTSPGSFGTKVASWIGKMVTKAATGGWQIGAGAGGDLLAKAISQYYGF